MPSDVVTIVVTTGIGVSVVAGVLSGVCYILIQGSKLKRSRNPALQWHCAVCGSYLRSYLAEDVKIVICVGCEERVCKQRCSKYDCRRKGWTCYACLKRPSWIQTILQSLPLRNNNKGVFAETAVSSRSEKMDEKFDLKRKREKMLVRDFIENLVSSLLGASVDDASISKIYKDKHYDSLFTKYHQELKDTITNLSSTLHSSICDAPFTEASSSSSHAKLKHTIQRIFEEAARLPSFRKLVENHASDFSEGEQTYEGLLATAILNKIITKHENDLPSTSSAPNHNNKYAFGNSSWETEASDMDLDFSSLSSSDSTPSSTKYIDRVSWTIQQRIEEEGSTEVLDFDERPLSRTNSLLSNSDSNWYLQRRQFHSSNSPVPVPMLVPNSLMNAKVLIGDKEAAETSDLSDASSDCENEDLTLKDFAKSDEWQQVSDEDSSFDSGVREDEFSDKQKFYGKTETVAVDENIGDEGSPYEDSQFFDKYSSLSEANLRFGRDYYTRQASSPSGKVKREEEEENNNSYELFRAVPATTDNVDNVDSISQLTNNSDLSLINYYDVENSKVYFRTPDNNQNFEVTLNDKQASNEFVEETAIDTIVLSEPKVRLPEPSPVKIEDKPLKNNEKRTEHSAAVKTAKKSDNTWIKQIYSNPTVRNFALTNREKIPFEYDNNDKQSKVDYKSSDANSSSHFSVQGATEETNNFSLEFSDNGSVQEEQVDEVNEIEMLKEQRLVAHRLGEFSSSFPNLAKINSSEKKVIKNTSTVSEVAAAPDSEDVLPNKFVSVKDLRKIFENKDASSHKDKPMHSLTARSISKNTKEKLKNVTNE